MTLSDRPTIMILNGPNLNKLGIRQPKIYGHATLEDVKALCVERADRFGLDVDFRQTNSEGTLVDWIQECMDDPVALVINPGAYSHTSVALYDAVAALENMPVFEVHLSNIHRREKFRHHSYVSNVATGAICGLGIQGYRVAVDAAADALELSGPDFGRN